MVKVTRGELSGERKEGYHQYRGGFEKSEGFGIRRALPTSKIQTEGETLAQQRQKKSFGLATSIYSTWSVLQKDFYQRSRVKVVEIDKDGREKKRILKGRSLALRDIILHLIGPEATYKAPLPFCICAVDENDDPAPGVKLKIATPKLKGYSYNEENAEVACFPPSATSPIYEPYMLLCGEALYGPWTAQKIHETKYLSTVIWTAFCGVTSGAYSWSGTINTYTCTIDFAAFGITKPEVNARVPLSHYRISLWDAEIYVTVNGIEIFREFCSYQRRKYPDIQFKAHHGDVMKVWLVVIEGSSSQVSVWNQTVEGANVY